MMPSIGVLVLTFVPIIVLKIHGPVGAPDSALYAGSVSFAYTTEILGGFLIAFLLLALVKANRMKIPLLALDEKGLKTPLILFPWPLVGKVWVGRALSSPVLCISSTNDEAMLKRLPGILRFRYAVRRRIYGAPVLLPAVRGMSLQDVCDLIDEYRTHFNAVK